MVAVEAELADALARARMKGARRQSEPLAVAEAVADYGAVPAATSADRHETLYVGDGWPSSTGYGRFKVPNGTKAEAR